MGIKGGGKSKYPRFQAMRFQKLPDGFRTMTFQKVAVGIDGVESEFFRQRAAFRKRQYVSDGAAVRTLGVGGCIRYIQCPEPSTLLIFQNHRVCLFHYCLHLSLCNIVLGRFIQSQLLIMIDKTLYHVLDNFPVYCQQEVSLFMFAVSDAIQKDIFNIISRFFIVDVHGLDD